MNNEINAEKDMASIEQSWRTEDEPRENLCPKCHDGTMEIEFFWQNGVKGPPNGDIVCDNCGFRQADSVIL